VVQVTSTTKRCLITTGLPFFSPEYIERSWFGWSVTLIGYNLIKLPHQDASWATLWYYGQDEVASLKINMQIVNECIQLFASK
jgi:hypothetical protein